MQIPSGALEVQMIDKLGTPVLNYSVRAKTKFVGKLVDFAPIGVDSFGNSRHVLCGQITESIKY